MKVANCTEFIASLLPAIWGRHQSLATRVLPGITLLPVMAMVLAATIALQANAQTAAKDTTKDTPTDKPLPAAAAQPASASTAEPAPAEPPAPRYSSREERDMSLLAERQRPDSVVWLTAIEQRFMSLYEKDLSGQPVGAVLIVNAEGQHSSWPSTSERIRLSLPEYGWSTLSTELPAPRPLPVPERSLLLEAPAATSRVDTDTATDIETPAEPTSKAEADSKVETEPTAEADSTPPAAAYPASPEPALTPTADKLANDTAEGDSEVAAEDMAMARLQQAIDFLQQQGQFNIVLLGEGIGAARAACFGNQQPKTNPKTRSRLIRAMVLVNARNRIEGSETELLPCLRDPQIPVLDVYTGTNARDRVEARARLRHSRRLNFSTYQQVRLAPLTGTPLQGENQLSRRVRGFLSQHARGVKVDNAVIKR